VFIVLCWIAWKIVFETVDEIKSVISTYQRLLMEMPYVPKTSYGYASLGDDGEANKLFLTILFSNTSWHPVLEGRGIASQQGAV
jgi:hypothetical protein